MIAIGADRFRSRAAASPESGAGSGGHVDDISKRLGVVETSVAEIRVKLDTVLPHLATKADIQSVRVEISSVRAEIGTVRVEVGSVRADMNAMETRLVGGAGALETKLTSAAGTLETKLTSAMGALETKFTNAMGSLETRMVGAMGALENRMVTAMGALETRMVAREKRSLMWMVGTAISLVGAMFAIAKHFS